MKEDRATSNEVVSTESVNNLPPGLTYDRNVSAITGVPTVAGTFVVNVIENPGSGTRRLRSPLTIIVQPEAPPGSAAITSGSSVTARIGRRFSFQVLTTGPNGRLTATGLPRELSLDPSERNYFGQSEDRGRVCRYARAERRHRLYQSGHIATELYR